MRALLSILIALAATVCRAETRVLVIGIKDYRGNAVIPPLPYADKDARLLLAEWRKATVVFVPNEQASLLRLHKDFSRVILGAQPGDTVCILISARGMAAPEDPDGYVLTADATRPTVGLKVSELLQMIEASFAENVLLFADVAREPSMREYPNVINTLLMGRLSRVLGRTAVEGLLGSQPGKLSRVDPQLGAPDPGFGLFSYYLAEGLRQKLATSTALHAHLTSRISRDKQVPVRFASTGSAGGVSIISGLSPPVLLASLRPWALFPQAAQPATAQSWETAAVQLADDGQRAIARYGAADYLPGDPLRADEKDFAAAARSFAAALRLTPDTAANTFFRSSLEARRLFCTGRADPRSDAGRQALEQCLRMPEGPRPEAWNALGIHHLETRRDYEQAADSFRQARELAPRWAYPRHNLALALVEQGDYESAEREYRDAISVEPGLPYLYYNLGLLLQRTNRYREARDSYRNALAAYDTAAAALENRAAEWESVYPADAKLARARAAVFKKNKAEVYNAMGTLEQARGDRRDALNRYNLALQANPMLWVARHNRAMILARDDPSRARQELELILKQNPQNRAVQRALERLRQGP